MNSPLQRVLLVDDSEECRMVVERALAQCGVELVKASSLGEARRILAQDPDSKFDLLLLDLGLPDGDGLSLLADQPSNPLGDTSVFLFTGRAELESKLAAFDYGVDDYLVKPVNPPELKARVVARLKKIQRHRAGNASLVKKDRLTLHLPQMKALLREGSAERDLGLTSKEFKILYFLISHEGKTLARTDLIKEVWGEGVHVLERTVDSHVAGLRRKLGPANGYVRSVPGSGYRFSAESDGTSPRP